MEPERNIEKLLRAFAKKRRQEAGDPLELHPATRRILQGEVARSGRTKQANGGFAGQFKLHSRFVFGLAVLGIVGMLAAMLLPALSRAKHKAGYAQRRLVEMNVATAPVSKAARAMEAQSPVPAAMSLDESSLDQPTNELQPMSNSKLASSRLEYASKSETLDQIAGDRSVANEPAATTAPTLSLSVESNLPTIANNLTSGVANGSGSIVALGVISSTAVPVAQARVDADGTHVQIRDRFGVAYDGYRQDAQEPVDTKATSFAAGESSGMAAVRQKDKGVVFPPPKYYQFLLKAGTNQSSNQQLGQFLFTNGIPAELRTNSLFQAADVLDAWTGWFLIPKANSSQTGWLERAESIPVPLQPVPSTNR